MRVLFATDGSEPANAALEFLTELPLPRGSTVQVLTVCNDLEWQVPPWVKAAEYEWGQKVSRKATRTLARDGVEVTTELRNGAPAREIIHAAAEFNADLVVVGSQGLSGVSRFLLGSVSNNVARHADRPVLVGRTPQHRVQQVVLAVDESEHAGQAAAFLARMPLPEESEIIVAQVVRPFTPYGGMVPTDPSSMVQLEEEEVRAQRLDEAEKRVRTVAAELEAAGKHATAVVRTGNPAAEILDLAAERQADLIVAGARGVSLIRGLIVGSVADHLLKSASCSVLLVHAPERVQDVAIDDESTLRALHRHAELHLVFAAATRPGG